MNIYHYGKEAFNLKFKRERCGVKIFINCESTSGYLLGFIIYAGASTDYDTGNILNLLKDFDSYKSPSKVVLQLLEKYNRQGYIVTLDNYYNSPELVQTLFQLQTDCYGTLRRKKAYLEISGTGSL